MYRVALQDSYFPAQADDVVLDTTVAATVERVTALVLAQEGPSRAAIALAGTALLTTLRDNIVAAPTGIGHTGGGADDRRRVLLEHAALANCNEGPVEMVTDEREVTMLFADLRNSTALSTALDPNETYELMSQVTECLTAAVIEHDGLIIDYYGDGLAAMWNAPADQSDHAELACRAALRMLQSLPEISADWAHVIETELQLGIGVHTGMAHVGNTGSRHRTKYGPRGTNVNLTSRIEAATKQLGIPLLVTKATASRLSNCIVVHRVCRAQMPGFDEPIDGRGGARKDHEGLGKREPDDRERQFPARRLQIEGREGRMLRRHDDVLAVDEGPVDVEDHQLQGGLVQRSGASSMGS